jgi:hypothetical protein
MTKESLKIGIWLLVILAVLGACGEQRAGEAPSGATGIQVESSAFAEGATIPQKYTCDGEDISPPLAWEEPPADTQSLALVCDDPDAPSGTWDHWILFNIPNTVRSLPEGVPADGTVAGIGSHGSNSWKRLGYGGPCPPQGSTHHYSFRIYALDTSLDLEAGASKKDLEKAMAGHILAEGQLVGQYGH